MVGTGAATSWVMDVGRLTFMATSWGVKFERRAVGSEVRRAADQMTRMMIFDCSLDILSRIGYMMARYLSILIATIV